MLSLASPYVALAESTFAAADQNLVHASDHLIIKFKREVLRKKFGDNADRLLLDLNEALELPGVEVVEPDLPQDKKAADVFAAFSRFKYLRLPHGLEVSDAIQRLQNHPLIEYVEPDFIATGGAIPNDPNYGAQYYLPKISAPNAWNITTGSSNVIIAILDSGLNNSNGEFTGRTVAGYDFANNDSNPADDNGHGTSVAGVAAANANNSALVAGVDWQCRIMPVKVFDANNNGLYSWLASGIDFAVAHGCKVINYSGGGSGSSTAVTQSILNAISNGVIFVTITHNDGVGTIRFPGNLTNCITVGATDARDRRASFSNYGPQIDLVAPGTNITTVRYLGGLAVWYGTSFSAPQVTGVAGLLASLDPNITQDQVQTLLCAAAEDRVGNASDTAGFDKYYGWGRLNALYTLQLAQTRPQISHVGSDTLLTWTSPANTSIKKPFRIEFADAADGPWTTIATSTNFTYTTNNTIWRDNHTETGAGGTNRFYRIKIVAQ